MTARTLRPWTELVKLHPDVEAGALTESVFAIDLGAIAAGDPDVPVVNRDPEAFFRATYLTTDLRKLLEEVLASLAGEPGYDRVLKLRTPFGGGKSHTLASLLHAARNRKALDVIPESKNLARPGDVAVAVFDGEKFDALQGKAMDGGQTIQTMWGWIAWQIDSEKAFSIVADHDRDRVAPGGDTIKKMLTVGAAGRPVLILLDEVLKYMERAAAVPVLDSTLQRQAKDFFQNLTVEVAGTPNTALTYSLTWSHREAFGNVALLDEIDKLAARVDQQREPVTGDEILPILQRRLLGQHPEDGPSTAVAAVYQEKVTGMWRAYAETPAERRQAEEEGRLLRDRMQTAYPFHPTLIDVMRERWTAVDAFQRTRGALRFLASCLQALKKNGGAQPLLGPGDVPLAEVDVRVKMLKELGAQNHFDPVIIADITGPNARAKRIDDRLARETPALANVKPATRIATAILLYSFGGLRSDKAGESEPLPPGVNEDELLSACVGPNLDNITAGAVLKELRENCLYLHYDGVRYCFKKDPNVTKLIEDAEQEVSREERQSSGIGPVRERIKEMLEQRLAGHPALIWPAKSQDIPDGEPRFQVAYLPMEFSRGSREEKESEAKIHLTQYGDRPRRFRNGLGLAIPDRKQVETLRRATRYLLAIERVREKKNQLRLNKDQLEQLKERERAENAAAESTLRDLYTAIWLPRVVSGEMELEKVERGGRPLRATGVHERIQELLNSGGIQRIHQIVYPRKIAERVRLGEESGCLGIKTADVLEAFYRDIHPPRLESSDALRQGIARGISDGHFAYTSGPFPSLGADKKYQVNPERVVINQPISKDEVDFESGFLMIPPTIPESAETTVRRGGYDDKPPEGEKPPQPGEQGDEGTKPYQVEPDGGRLSLRIKFRATRDQIFKSFPAIANVAERSDDGQVTITVEGISVDGYDPSWYRNAVEEPLDEADVEPLSEFEPGSPYYLLREKSK